MYHRIANPLVDPWGLAVRPDRFEQQLAVLARSRQPLPMSEFAHRLQRGTLPDTAVGITFDDGYVDNLQEAKPRLAAAGMTATLFLTTGSLDRGVEFWWDELARGILLREAPLDCEVTIAGDRCRLRLPEDKGAARRAVWRAWDAPQTSREALYLDLWRRLQKVSGDERDEATAALRAALELAPAAAADLPMRQTDVAELTAGGVFEIGGHTVSHPVLPSLSAAERRREILEGKHACERAAASTAAGFAYPHGAFDPDSRAAVRECGFSWACSTASRSVSPRDYDLFALPRIAAGDWDGETFQRELERVCA
jgi:peptidoglycan/xylan/chitin deacetylase (PgdA/CDA1 family)